MAFYDLQVHVVRLTRGVVAGHTYKGRRKFNQDEHVTVLKTFEQAGQDMVHFKAVGFEAGHTRDRFSKVSEFIKFWDPEEPLPTRVEVSMSLEAARALRDPGDSDESCDNFNRIVDSIQAAIEEALEEHDGT